MLRAVETSVKWYMKGLFPLKLLIPLYSVILLFDALLYIHVSGITDPQAKTISLFNIIVVISLFLNPLIMASGIAHVARTRDMTVYELSMIGSWFALAIGRLFALLIYIIPYLSLQSALLYTSATGSGQAGYEVVVLTITMLLFYYSLGMLLTLSGSRVVAVIGLSMMTFFLPISTWILVSTSQLCGITSFDQGVSIMLYLFNPPMAYMYEKVYGVKLAISWIQGTGMTGIVSLLLIALYIYVFTRRQELKI